MVTRMTRSTSRGKRSWSRDQHLRVEKPAQRAVSIYSRVWFSASLHVGGKGKLLINGRNLGVCRPLEEEEELEPDTPLEPGGNNRMTLGQEVEVQEQRRRS